MYLGPAPPLAVFSYKLRYIAGFGLVEMAISTDPKPAIYRNLYENTGTGKKKLDLIAAARAAQSDYLRDRIRPKLIIATGYRYSRLRHGVL